MKKLKQREVCTIVTWFFAVVIFLTGCKKDKEEIQPPPAPAATAPLLSGVSAVTTAGPQEYSYLEITSEITSSGGAAITEYGHVYSDLKTQPTLADSIFKKGAYAGTFPVIYKQELSKLKLGMIYYVRPFATNEKGTTYGETVKLTTATRLPELSSESHSVGETFIKITSKLIKDGGGKITQHGHLLFEGSPPGNAPQTVPASAQKTMLGTYTGTLAYSFSSEFPNLKVGTRYSVYAYATNEAGTVYAYSGIQTAGSQEWKFDNFRDAIDIGVSAKDAVWMIAGPSSISPWNVYQLVTDKTAGTTEWVLKGSQLAQRVAVAPDGTAWVVDARALNNRFGRLMTYKDSKWIDVEPFGIEELIYARDVGIGADGSVWIVSNKKVSGGYAIYKVTQLGNQYSFEQKTGGGERVAVDPSGKPGL